MQLKSSVIPVTAFAIMATLIPPGLASASPGASDQGGRGSSSDAPRSADSTPSRGARAGTRTSDPAAIANIQSAADLAGSPAAAANKAAPGAAASFSVGWPPSVTVNFTRQETKDLSNNNANVAFALVGLLGKFIPPPYGLAANITAVVMTYAGQVNSQGKCLTFKVGPTSNGKWGAQGFSGRKC